MNNPLGESARVELANAGVKVPCLTVWLRLYTEHSHLRMRVNENAKERKTKAPIRRYCLTGAYNESWITRFYPQNFHVYSPHRQERLQKAVPLVLFIKILQTLYRHDVFSIWFLFNLRARYKFLASYLYYTTEILYSQQQICYFLIF